VGRLVEAVFALPSRFVDCSGKVSSFADLSRAAGWASICILRLAAAALLFLSIPAAAGLPSGPAPTPATELACPTDNPRDAQIAASLVRLAVLDANGDIRNDGQGTGVIVRRSAADENPFSRIVTAAALFSREKSGLVKIEVSASDGEALGWPEIAALAGTDLSGTRGIAVLQMADFTSYGLERYQATRGLPLAPVQAADLVVALPAGVEASGMTGAAIIDAGERLAGILEALAVRSKILSFALESNTEGDNTSEKRLAAVGIVDGGIRMALGRAGVGDGASEFLNSIDQRVARLPVLRPKRDQAPIEVVQSALLCLRVRDVTRDGAAIALANVRNEEADVSSDASCTDVNDGFAICE
jgi:hypothetical protein